MPRRRRQTNSANFDRNKLYLEIAGIVIAALVLVYTANSYYLEKVANNPRVSILQNIARTPADVVIEGKNGELLHRVYCNYYVRLSNQGGADAVVNETVARIRYKDRQEDLVVNDLSGWSNMLEDLLLTAYYNPYFPEIPKIAGRSIEVIYLTVEVEVKDSVYAIDFIDDWWLNKGPTTQPITVSFLVNFTNHKPLQTDEFYCAGITQK